MRTRRLIELVSFVASFAACKSTSAPQATPPPKEIPVAAPDEDLDGDGIPDRLDRCPNIPEDCDGFEDADGCPDSDNDGDGIPDECDLCPNEPENKNGVEDEDGCPEPRVLAPGPDDPIVAFDWRSAKLKPDAQAVLGELAQVLKKDNAIERLAVIGHATPDEGGLDALSEARAHVAVDALVRLGIDGSRLEAHGVADREELVAENDPKHAKNRRVSFVALRARGLDRKRWDGHAVVRIPVRPSATVCPSGYPRRPPIPCRKK